MPLKKKRRKKIVKKRRAVKKSRRRINKLKKVKKRIKSKKISKARAKKTLLLPGAKEIKGEVIHFFPKVRAGVIRLKKPLRLNESIWIKGHTTNFKQTVSSMQINRVPIKWAKKGDEIGLLVNSRVRQGDVVYKI